MLSEVKAVLLFFFFLQALLELESVTPQRVLRRLISASCAVDFDDPKLRREDGD